MKVIISENKGGYKWVVKENIYVKGKVYSKDVDEYLTEDKLVELLKQIKTPEEFSSFLQSIDGIYSIIIDYGDSIMAAVDISRSMPIYFSSLGGGIVSDRAELIREEIGLPKEAVSEFYYTQLLACDYIFGQHTVYDEIKQLDLGEYIVMASENIQTARYFYHLNKVEHKSKEKIKKELMATAERVFRRLKKAVGDRPVVLSMSGGYDSRFVGCMMKKAGFTDVSCYTYGKQGSFEVEQSRKNAEALGFRWTCVDYTDEEVKRAFDEVGQKYLFSYDGHDFTAYMQNFPAVRKIHEDRWVKPGSVFVTGLCGDMPAGIYIEKKDLDKTYSAETAAEWLYGMLYTRYKMDAVFEEEWKNRVTKIFESQPIEIKDYQSWVSAIDAVYTGTCHSHWYMNMNGVHSFFGYEWLLPLWDQEWLKLWYGIPAEIRYKRRLYEDWLMDDVCSEYGLNQKKYVPAYSRNAYVEKIMRIGGSVIMFLCLNLGFPFKRKYDYNNFAPLELLFFKNLKSRKTVKYSRAGIMSLMNQYILQNKYGVKIMKKVSKNLR